MEDYKGNTGDYADTNRDGKVDFSEYMNDCDDFNKIYRNKNHSTGRYKPQQQQPEGKSIGKVGWILMFICCFAPIFSSILNADGEYMGGCIILTIVFLISWVICFCNSIIPQKRLLSYPFRISLQSFFGVCFFTAPLDVVL